jgi:hypothetical protein
MSMALCAECGDLTDTDEFPDIGETEDFRIICQHCNTGD